jgi:hypothetical protein
MFIQHPECRQLVVLVVFLDQGEKFVGLVFPELWGVHGEGTDPFRQIYCVGNRMILSVSVFEAPESDRTQNRNQQSDADHQGEQTGREMIAYISVSGRLQHKLILRQITVVPHDLPPLRRAHKIDKESGFPGKQFGSIDKGEGLE